MRRAQSLMQRTDFGRHRMQRRARNISATSDVMQNGQEEEGNVWVYIPSGEINAAFYPDLLRRSTFAT